MKRHTHNMRETNRITYYAYTHITHIKYITYYKHRIKAKYLLMRNLLLIVFV
jgi:hypothetical protein